MRRHFKIITWVLLVLGAGHARTEPVFDEPEPPRRKERVQTESEEETRVLPARKSRGDRERRYSPRRRRPSRPSRAGRSSRRTLEVDKPILKGWGANSVSILIHTPLIAENVFDKRFTSFGADFLFSGALAHLGESAYLHGELGLGATLSRLSALPAISDFTHVYFQVPFRLRLLVPLQQDSFTVEFILGFHIRLFEYDSRPTSDGGFFFVTGGLFNNLDGNAGIGLNFRLSDGLRLRLVAEYINLSLGLEF